MLAYLIEHIRWPTLLCIIAGLVATTFINKLSGNEKLVLLLFFLNIAADLFSSYLRGLDMSNGDVYNIIGPIAKILCLSIYIRNTKTYYRRIHVIGMMFILIISLGGYAWYLIPGEFHNLSFIASGLIFASLSYVHMRQIVLEKAGQSQVIFFFAMANLIYYTLMVSSISALPVAQIISNEFAIEIYIGNDIGYALWSLTTLFGIIWNRKQR